MIYLRQIEKEKRKIEEINQEIAKYEGSILNQKKRLGGENAAHVNDILIQNQIRILGHRVEKQLSELQKIKLMNSELRKGIENHRLERVQSDILYRKFEEALHTKKNEMAIIIEDSKNAYQYREKTILEIQKLQLQSDKAKKGFEEDFQEFGELIKRYQNRIYQTNIPKVISFTKGLDDHGNNNNNNNNNSHNNSMNMNNSRTTTANTVTSRNATPNMPLNNIARNNMNNSGSSSYLNINDQDSSSTGSMAGTSLSLANITINNNSFNQSMTQLTSPNNNNHNNTTSAPPNYEASLARILEAFNCPKDADPDVVVSKFLDLENQNFSLFNYVNTTNAEIEKFEHSIDVMRNKIDQHKGIGVSENEVKKQRTKAILDKLQKTEASIHEYEELYKQTVQSIECLKLGIHNILARIGSANGNDAADLLSANFNGSDTVEVSDIIPYLGIIEQRTNEILHSYALSQAMTHNNEHMLQLPYLANVGNNSNNIIKNHGSNHSYHHNHNNHGNNTSRRNSQVAMKMKSSIPDLIHRAYGVSNNNNNNSNNNRNNDSDDSQDDDEDTDERPWGRNELENITKKDLLLLQRRKKSVSMKDITSAVTTGHY